MQDNSSHEVLDETWFMYHIRKITPRCGFGKSIVGAFVLLFVDVAFAGSFLTSLGICPIWFFFSILKNAIKRPGWRLALIRISIPIFALTLVLVNNSIQLTIAEANATRIIKACEEFHVANGKFPKTLDELVPRYLQSIPRAKYCLNYGEFFYFYHDDTEYCHTILGYYFIPPFGRRSYDFMERRWNYIDLIN